ncbi:hypothetical protein I2486_09580 [Cellulophaga sp. E16_2]|uniref:hypothetical protein n=1 Tax=Cellulophaga sp. E16_2 TaxID=2789297 RepID=UPI001A925BF5|nr:hypothetical protein [Cellulophaga sp. E16_2]MBO0591657.1 hypothetical protein [Cellulophaga sp. E16_2]
MNSLINIYHKIGLDNRIIGIFKNEIISPYTYNLNTINQFTSTFPPFFIPLFLDGDDPSYIGIIYHPFSERGMVFVKYDISAGYMWEIARNSNQLLTGFLINSIVNNDDEIDPDIKDFAAKINIEIDKIFLQTYEDLFDGSAFRSFRYFNIFSSETPAAYVQNLKSYDGDFPSIKSELNINSLNYSSDFEIHETVDLINVKKPLPWSKKNKVEVFNEFINNGDLNNAWLTLNCKGWQIKDVIKGLVLLNTKTKDELFHLVANNWIEGMQKANKTEEYY